VREGERRRVYVREESSAGKSECTCVCVCIYISHLRDLLQPPMEALAGRHHEFDVVEAGEICAQEVEKPILVRGEGLAVGVWVCVCM
jgi:hypothetical protein